MADRALDVWNWGAKLPVERLRLSDSLYGVPEPRAFLRISRNGVSEATKLDTQIVG